MKAIIVITLVTCFVLIAGDVHSQSTEILIGGEETELTNEGVISGRGSSLHGGLGAALLDTFNIYYQPLGEGDFQDNVFPDPEVYSFQMNIPAGLPNYQSQGIHGSFWDSRGREGEGVLPWIREDWREGRYFDAQYNPAGDESPFGVVRDSVQWKIDYWDVDDDEEIIFIHTCLSGMVEDFNYNEETGDATALLVTLQTAYLGYGEDGEPGPGAVDYEGGVYQGFDSFRERSGIVDFPAYFFQYDGETNEGSLTPCGTKVSLRGEGGVNGYFDSIQAGIDASEDGDTVLVAPGEYPVNLVLDNRNITLASWFLTTGDREFIEQTILNGSSRSQVINLTGENNQSLLCGLTLRNGLAPERLQGSGIDIRDGASPILRALIISENQGGNGAIWCQGVQDVVWDDLRIINNSGGQYCSGLILWESVVTVNDALFLGNDGGLAGALYLTRPEECILTLNRCEFDGNSSNTSGVAEVQRGSTLNLNHCYAHDNLVRDERGDWIRSSESVVNANFCLFECTDDNETVAIRTRTAPQDQRIVNCTFVGFGGYAILCQEGGVQVINSVLWGNGIQQNGVQIDGDVDVTFSLVENMEREGILNEDPLFVNPGEGDYHLTENSPCIDTGDPDSDPDPDGTRADMGAYYFHQDVAPEGFNYAGTFESHDYFLSENTTRWLNARDACENAGGYLVCIGSEEENVFIHQIVENFEIESGLLIGFNDIEEEDNWGWVNDEEIIYTNWTDGAPNNDGGEDYGRMEFQNGEWQDVRNAVTHFVLEIPDDRVLNVPDDYETIQAAINASEDGDTVLVAAGRYFENIDFSGKNISVIGNPDNPEEVMIDGSENGSVVTFANEETETAIISGFTIRNGSARFGGGIYCHNSNPQLIDVIISGNTAIDNGGGIYCLDNSSPTLTNVNISNNTAAKGGGIFMYYESCPALTSVSIKGNIASNQGGGIFCNDGCDAVLTHVTISGNAAENAGGGLVLHERSEPVIINSIFWDNEPQECYFTENGNPNILTISYSDFEGGRDGIITNNNGEVGWREGNINADPMFVDPENGDFNLSGDSPCIDTGTAFFVFEEDTLLDISEDNYIGDAPDMGTMEYDPADVGEKEGISPSSFILYPCYPNPFNSTTTIKYNLPFASQVRLNLYNLSGQRIEALVNRRLQAGVHRTRMYAGDLASGLYFVRLEAGGLINIQKVMLVK